MFYNPQVSPLYTDLYQLTMAQSYFLNGMHTKPAGFDYFFRRIPFKGGYVVFAGLQEFLQFIKDMRFLESDIEFLNDIGFDNRFLDYLKDFSFKGDIYAVREGDVVFPFEPVARIEGSLIETQLIETLLLNVLNFQSLIATKASRIRFAAGKRVLSDFGLRRAQSFGAMQASRAAIIGGFNSTSNVLASKQYGIPHAGTMAHSFIESFGDEESAFRAYADSFPDNSVFLVDTYNTLSSGIPNAIKVAKEMRSKGQNLKGIRLDSGDLSYLSKKARDMLDYDGFENVKIIVSNQLDEYVIKSLQEQKAPIDIFGVGTSLITGKPEAALDGVYKLAYIEDTPVLKISDNLQKTTLPGKKKILRYFDREGLFMGDAVVLADEVNVDVMINPFEKHKSMRLEGFKCEELYYVAMKNGEINNKPETPMEINERLKKRLHLLPIEHQRFDFPHIYKVGISEKLLRTRDELLLKHK
ncbi:MAG: nicotinate phosphoribosyltransferase [Bacteroidetes bacterium]|nr:MAG: nicotinate phosphoribosyltransferase [Bacteroidota bacterium]